ncbi:MAG: ABC transporter permease [Armatimonadetes bacterium]|nr:MAG: ABC transporter permease [Armatimonadota bacterium]
MKRYANFLGLLTAWLAVFGVFALLAPDNFSSRENFETILRQSTIVGFAAVGMTYVIVSGGIDLSVGSMIAFVTVLIAFSLERGLSPAFAAGIGVAGAAFCGLLNGVLITQLRVGAFIVTLGSFLVIRGVAKGIAHDQKIDAHLTWLSDLISQLGADRKWMIVPWGVWALILLSAVAAYSLRNSVFGRHVVAVGSNEQAARVSGVPVERTRVWVYVLGGATAGLAGLIQFSRLTVGDPTVAVGLELEVIAATVIGGASLSGGTGSVWGSLLGALIMSTIKSGCSHVLLPNWVQEVVTGCIIVAAVAIDRWRSAATS